jgi:hypothetical protein
MMVVLMPMLVAWLVVHAAGKAGIWQAVAEGRTVRAAVLQALKDKGTKAGAALAKRLEEDRKRGAFYPAFWAWAAMRTARAVRAAMRRRRLFRNGAGIVRRIAGAAWRGGKYAYGEARKRLRDGERPRLLRIGVCGQCGGIAAVTALKDGLCGSCRPGASRPAVAEHAEEAPPAMRDGDLPPDDEIPDAEIVGDPEPGAVPAPRCVRCGKPLAGFACVNPGCLLCPDYQGLPVSREGADPARWKLPVRICSEPGCNRQLMPRSTWYVVNATNADICLYCGYGGTSSKDGVITRIPARYPDGAVRERQPAELAAAGTPVDADGNEMPLTAGDAEFLAAEAGRIAQEAAAQNSPPDAPAGPTQPGQAAPPQPQGDPMTCAPDGELHTQADWEGLTSAIDAALEGIAQSAENTLKCLSAKSAGREHMAAVTAWLDQVTAVMSHGRNLVEEVNQHQDPYVDAVQGAGGSDEVADPDYYAEM